MFIQQFRHGAGSDLVYILCVKYLGQTHSRTPVIDYIQIFLWFLVLSGVCHSAEELKPNPGHFRCCSQRRGFICWCCLSSPDTCHLPTDPPGTAGEGSPGHVREGLWSKLLSMGNVSGEEKVVLKPAGVSMTAGSPGFTSWSFASSRGRPLHPHT